MNIETRTDQSKGIRIHIVRGEIDPLAMKTFLADLYRSDGFDHSLQALWDLREAVFSSISPTEIKEMAYFARVNWAEQHRRKTAVVISGDLHFGLSRMFEQFIGPIAHGKIKTFRDLPPAQEWIECRGSVAPHPQKG